MKLDKTGSVNELAIIILAAGLGKRMNNPELPKVLAELKGKPLIEHVLDASSALGAARNVLIVGHHKEKVISRLEEDGYDGVEFVSQDSQLGTGHAVEQAREALSNFDGLVLILAGDVPLLSTKTLQNFLKMHAATAADLTVLSTMAPNPRGYGRIVRSGEGDFLRITEEKDADEETKKIKEINSGVYLVSRKMLFEALSKVSNNNAQGEYYLTDIISILASERAKVAAFNGAGYDEIHGVNSPADLKEVEDVLENRNNRG